MPITSRSTSRGFQYAQPIVEKKESRGWSCTPISSYVGTLAPLSNKASQKQGAAKQIEAFKKIAKKIASQAMKVEDAELFKPAGYKGLVLKRLGIDTFLPMINAKVQITREETKAIDVEILKLKGIKQKGIRAIQAWQ